LHRLDLVLGTDRAKPDGLIAPAIGARYGRIFKLYLFCMSASTTDAPRNIGAVARVNAAPLLQFESIETGKDNTCLTPNSPVAGW
jgi:hypothetical protein